MFIQTGYGAEGPIPDATAFDITEYNIKPHFRNKDYEGGLATGIDLIEKALRGEYKGSGKTVQESGVRRGGALANLVFYIPFLIFLFIFVRAITRKKKHGYRYSSSGGPFLGGWSGGSGGGWSSGGGGGGFSGGGGSFGGGGAGSSW
jgi:uncharacterized protein